MSGVRPSPRQAIESERSVTAPINKCGMRNAECGIEWEGSIPGACNAPGGAHGPFRTPHSALRILSLAERKEVREEPICAGDAGRELPEEAQPGVHVCALAHRGDEQSTLERRLAGIVHLDERRVGGIPIVPEIQSPLLHPATPGVGPDFVWDVEHGAPGG